MNFKIFPFVFLSLFLLSAFGAQAQAVGMDFQVEVKEVSSSILGESHKLNVFLPLGYNESQERFPVLFILESVYHFFNGIQSSYELSTLGAQIPPMIVVGLSTKDRWMDLTPVHTEEWYGYPIPNSGNGENYLTFIEEEVVPFIENNYRTQPFKVVYGHSLGGLFTLYGLTEKPNLFGGYIASSPNLSYGDSSVIHAVDKLKSTKLEQQKFIYFCGDNDDDGYTKAINTFSNKLDATGLKVEHFYKDYQDETHHSVPDKSLPEGLKHIFKYYTLTDSIIQLGASSIQVFYEKASASYGYPIRPAWGYINYLGDMQMNQDNVQEAIDLFKYNTSIYPEVAFVFERLGKAYLKTGDKQSASINFQKALSLDPENEGIRKMLEDLQRQ